MILILKVFLRLLNSFEIIFRQETSIICTTAEVTEANFKCVFFYFLLAEMFLPRVLAIKSLTFSLQKHRMSGEFCCLFTGSWHRGFSMKDFVCMRIFSLRYILVYVSVLFYVNLHDKHVIHHTRLKQRVGMLTSLKENFASA